MPDLTAFDQQSRHARSQKQVGSAKRASSATRKHCNEIGSSLPVGQAGQLVRSAGGVAMAETVNLYDAKTNLSKLVDRAAAGEEIVIAKAGKPKAKLVPYRPSRKKRRFGQNLLGITYIADDFDGPLPPEIQKYFE
jgi:prevent-host-death family protein